MNKGKTPPSHLRLFRRRRPFLNAGGSPPPLACVAHQEDDQKVSEVSTTSKTSENLGKPRKLHDLETYVSFPGNLLKRTFMYIFSITKLLSRFPVSRFPGFRKPGNLQKCLKTQKLNGHLPDASLSLTVSSLPMLSLSFR